jgi:hypothetical protein
MLANHSIDISHKEFSPDEPNVALAPEEIATLSTLMQRYDQLLAEMDALNAQLEEVLKVESPSSTRINSAPLRPE